MNDQKLDEIFEAINGESMVASWAIRDTIKRLNDRGLLCEPGGLISPTDIRKSDRIRVEYKDMSGLPRVMEYIADADQHRLFTTAEASYYLLERDEPKIEVEDLEPGTRFRGRIFSRDITDWVVLRDDSSGHREVMDLSDKEIWCAVNEDFTIDKVLSGEDTE